MCNEKEQEIDDGPGFVASCCDEEITLKGDAAKRFLDLMGEKSCCCSCHRCTPCCPPRPRVVYPYPYWPYPPITYPYYPSFTWSTAGNDNYTITYSSNTQ